MSQRSVAWPTYRSYSVRVKSRNPWGQAIDVQRSDLWVVDLTEVVRTINATFSLSDNSLLKTNMFFASSVVFPEQAITPGTYRRDSQPYYYPEWDTPAGQVRITFLHDIAKNTSGDIRQSAIYQLLRLWRASVRSGRGPMSTEDTVTLNSNFQPFPFRFDIPVKFTCGVPLEDMTEADLQQGQLLTDGSSKTEGGLAVSSVYVLKNLWLSTIQMDDVAYRTADAHKINCTLYADDVVQL